MHRRAFGLIEVLIVVGVLGAVTSLSIPLYNEYQIRSDLELATQQTTQGLDRAKLLSQSGERDSSWGFYTPGGVLYKGDSYATRDTALDETYPMPSTIAISGLFDISFSKLKGAPSATGSIVLRALNNDERVIQVSIAIEAEKLATNAGDTLTICHYDGTRASSTITIPDATWPTHQSHGDTMGSCAAPSSAASSAVSSGNSSSALASSSAPASSSAAGGGDASSASSTVTLAECGVIYYPYTQQISPNGETFNVQFHHKIARINFGTQSNPPLTSGNGPQILVHVCYNESAGTSPISANWKAVSGGDGICKNSNGNATGNAVAYSSSSNLGTIEIDEDKNYFFKVVGRYKDRGYLAFNELFHSMDGTGHVKFLRNGDTLPSSSCASGSCSTLASYLASIGKWNGITKTVSLANCEILAATELETISGALSDYDDDVMLMTFSPGS